MEPWIHGLKTNPNFAVKLTETILFTVYFINHCVNIMKKIQKKPSSHSSAELSKTQFFPVTIVKLPNDV